MSCYVNLRNIILENQSNSKKRVKIGFQVGSGLYS